MIEYVVPGNIDDRILLRSAKSLTEGGLAGIPSDTSWLIACSLRSKDGIKKLRRLSGERDERHFTLLCSDIAQFGEFCRLDNTRFRLIKRLSPGPYVFILNTLLGTEKALGLRRKEIGVRIPNHPLPLALIKTLTYPLYSVTAKRSMTGINREEFTADSPKDDDQLPPIPEEDLFDGGWELEAIEGLNLILDTGDERSRIFSTILDLTGDEVLLLRQGAGPWPV
ncbi:MAG: L-threonylcarbamoyladenylate synthase [Spirochaetaceae bacterium]|jgi:tRNA threonylcarbamoyl adenosine modification protein (Sua5/YciO/YrdC/YwlC family)|nr:L-threonylcarbamoyladenylate synthase [Spirochaetaceae bacterium]